MSTDNPPYQCVYLSHSLRAMERKTGDQAKAPSLSASPATKKIEMPKKPFFILALV